MIDPLSVAAVTTVLTGVLNGATEEAGAASLKGLVRLLRRAAGPDAEIELTLDADDGAYVENLARMLVSAAERDDKLAGDLRLWVDQTGSAVVDASMTNLVDGTVHGPVVQGRDFSGPIHLG